MKKILLAIIIFSSISGLFAQENEVIKEESTVKRVVVRNGSKIEVKETKETVQEKGAVVVAGNEEENQTFSEKTKKGESNEVLVDEVKDNEKNQALVKELERKRKEEFEASVAAEKKAAERERKILEEKKRVQMAELEANRKRLEKRGKRMAKLDKNKRKKKNKNKNKDN